MSAVWIRCVDDVVLCAAAVPKQSRSPQVEETQSTEDGAGGQRRGLSPQTLPGTERQVRAGTGCFEPCNPSLQGATFVPRVASSLLPPKSHSFSFSLSRLIAPCRKERAALAAMGLTARITIDCDWSANQMQSRLRILFWRHFVKQAGQKVSFTYLQVCVYLCEGV